MYRHGDIMLRAIDPPQNTTTAQPSERLTLAHGEATGHAHVLHGLAIAASDRSRAGTPRALIHLLEPGELRHEEHGPIAMPPGWYEVIRQRIYAPASPRYVED